jgi:hypothetical protein
MNKYFETLIVGIASLNKAFVDKTSPFIKPVIDKYEKYFNNIENMKSVSNISEISAKVKPDGSNEPKNSDA